ncbi:MAG: DUF4293 domain-containing protein [Williamsia sp.]|nr:DUF4293 domain-containing protein [Williamsia sp.]
MIQRIQSVWFLLAALFGFLVTQVPLFVVKLTNNIERRILATESLLLFSVAVGLACLAAACVFLYKNRSLQFRLAVIGVVVSIALIALEVWQTGNYRTQYANSLVNSSYYWGGLLPVAMAICFILGARGVYKDQKLIRSQDRLR